ncbi:isocitrate/isopropylmalate dehydrogenase family protein [Rhizobiales bacterium]|uniref:isocitrate/isopropylmalate dehydrogenase family protein n=1 Tax=Hongsoonwoonella zoysiae TaxID=2821844 RepID=UPI001561A821|nr:isocitrate/isopropylmalate dehydrogenase family protein [Hongsoonwoonella zoysiae]NRG18993.1 isocitrate/isopropylmalate dehydrogenase family protein [Hongsoonwoonella zoysiae]
MHKTTAGPEAQNRPQSNKKTFAIAVFDGDGIGPEIMRPTLDILGEISASSSSFCLQFQPLPAGAGHYRDHAVALPHSSLDAARDADAILLSAMGLPDIRYPDGTEIAPQIELRFALELFAGVRPVFLMPGQGSPLRIADTGGVDFVIIRESTEGLFASHGKGEVIRDEEARETLVITRRVSEKLFDFAFRLARQRKENGKGPGRVHCVDKANVFQAFAFFRKIFQERAALNPDIEAQCAYVDAAALWMVQRPQMFDVIVTENMFGDILSDLGAGIMGSLGLAPSADIGADHAVFQPCHGSAPDIAGRNIANPLAMILSASMMLDWLGREHEMEDMLTAGRRLHEAVNSVLSSGSCLTPDIGGTASTNGVAEAVLEAYRNGAQA